MKSYLTPSGTFCPGRTYRKDKLQLAGLRAVGLALTITFAPATQVLAGAAEKGVTVASSVAPNHVHHPRENTFMKRQWGVEVLFVRETSAGYMLEFRYKVLDADKAKPLFERQSKPILTHAKSGAKLIVPTPAKTGALRNSNTPHAGTTYWMFFANPGKLVKPGDQVSIDIGDFRADGLVVR
ncbi:MAG: hypothetical protein PVG20_08810 [Thioalkalispiraceae bacterium]|jgi:hypothetical protein